MGSAGLVFFSDGSMHQFGECGSVAAVGGGSGAVAAVVDRR